MLQTEHSTLSEVRACAAIEIRREITFDIPNTYIVIF